VAEQAGLGVRQHQLVAQQRIVEQIDLPDRQLVRRPPPGVHMRQHFLRQRPHNGSVPMDIA
jgi:hypothetical protein